MTHTFYAPAKINLWLRVFASDQTGYHPLDTLFCAVDLADHVEVELAGDAIHLDVRGADLGPVNANLAFRAAQEYFMVRAEPPRARMTLHKHIPHGAGLGGGSSDAAAVLHALQQLSPQPLPDADVMAIAARLGSDVPFFLCGASLAHAGGHGEILRALPPLPQRIVLLLTPGFAIATAAAYRWLDEAGTLGVPGAPLPAPASWNDVERTACNDFEPVLFRRYAILQQLRDALLRNGADIAMISGSGSTVFGIFAEPATAADAQQSITRTFPEVSARLARTLTEPI